MRLRRLRAGEWTAGVAAVALLVLLGLPWFRRSGAGAHETGIRALGWVTVALALVAVLAVLALLLATVAERSPALPMALAVAGLVPALAALAAIVVRLVAEGGLRPAAVLGAVAAAAMLAGTWIAIADERTDTPEAREQAEAVLRVRGAPRPVPDAVAPAPPAPSVDRSGAQRAAREPGAPTS